MQSLVSIIMPVKNAMPFLSACLESILAQSYVNWELIVVNDGSEDSSREVLHHYASKDKRVQVLDNIEQGIIPALQLGYSYSSGAFITRMDADDIMVPTKIEVLRAGLSTHSKSVAVGQVEYFSSSGILGDGYIKYQNWLNRLTTLGNNFSEIYKECVIPSPSWMMSRNNFDAIGAFGGERYPEDYDLAFRMYQAKLEVVSCSKIIHKWRDYPDRTSRTDSNYSDNRFLHIKVHYFLQIDYDPETTLVVWGAGKKGKQIAQLLIQNGVSFRWVCDNPNKIGHNIYGVMLEDILQIAWKDDVQFIIAVAGDSQNQILDIQNKSDAYSGAQWYWFC